MKTTNGSVMVCPKCGFQQAGGTECLRCGIIFERYRPVHEGAPQAAGKPVVEGKTEPGLFWRFYRAFRWVALFVTVLAILLVLRQPTPPRIDVDPQARQRVEEKIQEMRKASKEGKPYTLRMDEAELNGWLDSNLALAKGREAQPATESAVNPEGAAATTTASTPVPTQRGASVPDQETTESEVRSSMRELKIDLLQDRLKAFVRFDFHGKELTLVLEGRVHAQNGYLRFEPLGLQVGSLPIPSAAVDAAVRRLFESPENREKFRLPPEIHEIHLANGQLMIGVGPR